MKKLTSWSFSRYSVYKLCPLKAKLSFIDRIKEPPNEAMARGDDIHKKAEKYIKGMITTLPKELKIFSEEFKALRKAYTKKVLPPTVEDTWAFTSTWDRSRWDDWVNCWVRIKIDCAHHIEDDKVLVVSDWKTGKYRDDMLQDYEEQLELYALAALLLHPHVEEVRTRLVYLDYGVVHPLRGYFSYKRSDLEKLKKTWNLRVRKMMKDTSFKPTPNTKCQWCFFRASNKAAGGGQCKY